MIRIYFTFAFLFILAACSTVSHDRTASDGAIKNYRFPQICPAMEKIPDSAEISRAKDFNLAVFPSRSVPKEFSGCMYVWIGSGDEPRTMVPLMAAYFRDRHAQWLVGQDPDDPQPFKCIYRNGALNSGESENAKKCPSAADLEH